MFGIFLKDNVSQRLSQLLSIDVYFPSTDFYENQNKSEKTSKIEEFSVKQNDVKKRPQKASK